MMNTQTFTFPKKEHLCGKIRIDRLFATNSSFVHYPLRVLFSIEIEATPYIPARILITVPKKHFKKAVDRNAVKRQLREAYRIQKSTLIDYLTIEKKAISLAFVYLSAERMNSEKASEIIEGCIQTTIKRMQKAEKK